MDYRDNRQRWAESHQVVHFYAGQWCTFTPELTLMHDKNDQLKGDDLAKPVEIESLRLAVQTT